MEARVCERLVYSHCVAAERPRIEHASPHPLHRHGQNYVLQNNYIRHINLAVVKYFSQGPVSPLLLIPILVGSCLFENQLVSSPL